MASSREYTAVAPVSAPGKSDGFQYTHIRSMSRSLEYPDNSPRVPGTPRAGELEELYRLAESVEEPLRTTLMEILDRSAEGMRKRRRMFECIQESLCQLRLDMKYILFDLEATRRERDDYRRRLEEYD